MREGNLPSLFLTIKVRVITCRLLRELQHGHFIELAADTPVALVGHTIYAKIHTRTRTLVDFMYVQRGWVWLPATNEGRAYSQRPRTKNQKPLSQLVNSEFLRDERGISLSSFAVLFKDPEVENWQPKPTQVVRKTSA